MLEKKYQDLITRVIAALFPGATIYLFGSRARGTNQPASDIDIAIDAKKPVPFEDIGQAREVMEVLTIPFKVDVVDLNRVPQELREEILKEGIIWKKGRR